MANTGKNEQAAQVANIIAGTKKRFPDGSRQVPIRGVPMTVDEVTAKMQTFVDNRDAVEMAQAAATAKVAAERAQAPSLLAIIAAYVAFVRLTFGNSADALTDFGIPPPKARTPMTAEAKAIAAAKARATRVVRGTASKKAKKNVKGHITARLVVTQVASPEPVASGNTPSGGTPAPTAQG